MGGDLIAYLDTQVVIWLTQGSLKRISHEAQSLIRGSDLLVSPMVILEVELLYEKSRIKLTWRDILTKLEPEIGLTVCDLRFDRIANSAVAEHWTHDPFDRLIVANAKANGLAYLISADEDIRRNYQRAVW